MGTLIDTVRVTTEQLCSKRHGGMRGERLCSNRHGRVMDECWGTNGHGGDAQGRRCRCHIKGIPVVGMSMGTGQSLAAQGNGDMELRTYLEDNNNNSPEI